MSVEYDVFGTSNCAECVECGAYNDCVECDDCGTYIGSVNKC